MSNPVEDLTKLDPALVAAYGATPWIRLNETSYAAIRKAGGISAEAAMPEDVEVIALSKPYPEGVIFKKKDAKPDTPVVVWFHGGGYVFGSPAMHGGLYLQFVAAGMTVFAPKYRLSPEVKYPAAHDDGLNAWEWLTSVGAKEYGVMPLKVALAGTSAGGGCAASVALRIRDAKSSVQPRALLLNIPWLAKPPSDDTPVPGEPSWTSVKIDKIWSLANCQWASSVYFPPGTANPGNYAFAYDSTSLADLPPTIVCASELDILRDSAVRFAQRVMAESSKGASLHVYKGAYHGSTGAVPLAAVSIAQNADLVAFAKAALLGP